MATTEALESTTEVAQQTEVSIKTGVSDPNSGFTIEFDTEVIDTVPTAPLPSSFEMYESPGLPDSPMIDTSVNFSETNANVHVSMDNTMEW